MRSCDNPMCSLLAKMDSGSHYKYMYTSMQYVLQGGRRGGRGEGGGLKCPRDFKLMLLCVQAVTAKGRPKFRQCYTYKIKASKYINLAPITGNKLDPRG